MSAWPSGPGEMAARIRAHDWSTTPLGPVAGWPQALRIATRLLLDTRHPMLVWWGPELIQLYNDAYRDTLGPEKHPAALGGRGRDTWAEIWDGAGPQIAQVMGGGPATWHEDQLLPVTRHGGRRDAWWTYSLSPIEDEAAPNGVGGVLMVGRDVTREHVVRAAALDGEARQAFLLALSDALRALSDPVAVQRAAMKLLAERLDVMRASYFEVDADQDGFTLTARHERNAVPIPDRMRLSDFSPALAEAYRKGRPLVFRDTEVEAEEESQREAYRAVGVRAWAAVPLVKGGLLTSIVGVHSATPRGWSSVEVRLIEDVAERTWAAVERARAEAELRRSEELRRVAIEGGGMGTWRWNVADGMIRGDAAFLSLWGFPPSDEPHRLVDFTDRMAERGRKEMAAIVSKAIEAGEAFDGQLEVGAGPTRGRWVQWRGRADPERPTVIDGVSFDVTEQRAAEIKLRESEEQQRLTLQLVPAMLWWADAAGREVYSNERWKFYTGQREVDSHDYGWLDAIHPDDLEGTRAAFARAFATGEPIERQQRIRQAGDGYRWHLVRHVPVRDGTGAILRWFGAAIDVHDLHELQDRQGVLVAELQHRTRNLMGVVQAMFEDTLRSTDDMGVFVVEIRDRLRALGRVQGLLSRLGDGERVTFDALIRDEMRAVGAPSEGGRVTLAGPDGVALRSSTVQTFAMAIHELATNAMKYGALKQPAGRLAVTWRLASAGSDGRPWLHVDWRESGVAMPPDGAAPRGTGQGRQLIEQALPYQLGAVTTYVMAEDGVRCSIAVPVSDRTTAEEIVR